MAIFSNQATLTYNGITTNSNVAYGEILDLLTIFKTSVEGSYSLNSIVTYVITMRNTGNTALTDIIISENFDMSKSPRRYSPKPFLYSAGLIPQKLLKALLKKWGSS